MEDHEINLSDRQKELIEKMGVLIEKHGSSPAGARVQSLLLVSDETTLTFDQIKDTLKLSKSATSNAINALLQTNKLEYITKIGDRKRYFRTMMHKWADILAEENERVKVLSDTLSDVLRERTGETTEFNTKMKELIDFLNVYRETVGVTFEKWNNRA